MGIFLDLELYFSLSMDVFIIKRLPTEGGYLTFPDVFIIELLLPGGIPHFPGCFYNRVIITTGGGGQYYIWTFYFLTFPDVFIIELLLPEGEDNIIFGISNFPGCFFFFFWHSRLLFFFPGFFIIED